MVHSNRSSGAADPLPSTPGDGKSAEIDHPVRTPVSTVVTEDMAVRNSRLQVTFEIAKILVAETNLEAMLRQLLSVLIRTTDAADAGSVWLHDPVEDRLVARGAEGYCLAALQQLRLYPGEAMAGRVFQSGKAELYATPEATADAMANLTPANQKAFEAATTGLSQPLSAVCVPLSTPQMDLGVLVLLSLRRRAAFTQADLDLLQRLADLITLAIETALLREDLEDARTLSEANRLKAELISTLAHEMRTPLTSIKGYSTALLMDEIAFDPETQREFLHIIDEECDTLQDLIHDILESSIIDAGLLRLELQPVLLPRLVQGVVDDIARRTERHRILVDLPDSFPVLDADPERITQVLRNLLDNAIKYSPDGGLIVVRAEVRPREAVVAVADQGLGIAPEHLHQLFEKYFRAKTGLAQHVVGSGLGLPICHALVQAHGGRIWAESVLGQGSTFYFTLPLATSYQPSEEPEGGRE
jgi:signal transduction histidine kinase